MLKQLATRISKIPYVRSAIEDQAGLEAFRQKPTRRIVIGFIIIGISYTIGWPAVGALSMLSIYYKKPLILAVGGPVVYGLSHLVFILGAYLAGSEHAKMFFRWALRVTIEKLMADPVASKIEPTSPPETGGR